MKVPAIQSVQGYRRKTIFWSDFELTFMLSDVGITMPLSIEWAAWPLIIEPVAEGNSREAESLPARTSAWCYIESLSLLFELPNSRSLCRSFSREASLALLIALSYPTLTAISWSLFTDFFWARARPAAIAPALPNLIFFPILTALLFFFSLKKTILIIIINLLI